MLKKLIGLTNVRSENYTYCTFYAAIQNMNSDYIRYEVLQKPHGRKELIGPALNIQAGKLYLITRVIFGYCKARVFGHDHQVSHKIRMSRCFVHLT